MQGNGERYPALIAQVLALLERDIEPKLIFGGSSAAGAAVLIRRTLRKPFYCRDYSSCRWCSLKQSRKSSSYPSDFTGPGSSLIVFPSINEIGATLTNFAKFIAADSVSQSFIGQPSQKLAPIESASGQIILLSEFYAQHDFSQALNEK